MNGWRRRSTGSEQFDFFAKAEGQTVHCDRAAFFAPTSIPSGGVDRAWLGAQLGFGFVAGGGAAVGALSLVSKVITAVFA